MAAPRARRGRGTAGAREPEARFEETLDLEWPVEGLEPLSFVFARLLDPLRDSPRTRRSRGRRAAPGVPPHDAGDGRPGRCSCPRRCATPKALRTLLLLHLESHPLDAGVDRVSLRVDPAPARVVQFSLFSRALPFPEQMATLVARLGALTGERRVGAAGLVDSHRPGAFRDDAVLAPRRRPGRAGVAEPAARYDVRPAHDDPDEDAPRLALRRFRLPIAARVVVDEGRPVRVATDRRGIAGGRVEAAAGPWRTSGEWWHCRAPGSRSGPTAAPRRWRGTATSGMSRSPTAASTGSTATAPAIAGSWTGLD